VEVTDRCFSCDRRLAEIDEVACAKCVERLRGLVNRPNPYVAKSDELARENMTLRLRIEDYKKTVDRLTAALGRVKHECGCVEQGGEFVAWCLSEDCREAAER
jgi:hypothetical protein